MVQRRAGCLLPAALFFGRRIRYQHQSPVLHVKPTQRRPTA
jgi:hypothetical protein